MRKSFLRYLVWAVLLLPTGCSSASSDEGYTYDHQFERSCHHLVDKVCRISAQDLSMRDSKPLPLVAYGGNKALFETAKRVVRIFNDNGVRAYMLHAKDRDTLIQTMHVDFYANGGTKYGLTAYDNRHISQAQTERDLLCQGKKAYREAHGTYDKNTKSTNNFLLPSSECEENLTGVTGS